jgi:hypothetical protein
VKHSKIRAARQASDFQYVVYKWLSEHRKLCLHSQSDGIPPDQLAGEMHDSTRFVRLYTECVGLDEAIPAGDILNRQSTKIYFLFC